MQKAMNKPSQHWYTFEQLSTLEKELFKKAIEARSNAQAPYSNFHVGAALVTDDGNIYAGCNVERCTLTQTTHAEQNAIDSMIAGQGPSKIAIVSFIAAPADKTIVLPQNVVAQTNQQVSPCGHCLQIIWENCYGDAQVKVMALLPNGQIYAATIGQLLPVRFGPQDLGVEY